MSDLIKRADAIKAIWGDDINPSEDGMVFEAQSHIDRDIKLIPSADRPQEWIPCSERLPEEPFGCLVTVEDSYFNGSEFIDCESILPYFVGWDGEQWNDDDGERCPFEVLAWMPLPKPWKGADDE